MKDIGVVLHAAVGFTGGVVTGVVGASLDSWLLPTAWIFGIGIFGWLREVRQHDWNLTWPHQVLEAAAWGISAVAGALVGVVCAILWVLV